MTTRLAHAPILFQVVTDFGAKLGIGSGADTTTDAAQAGDELFERLRDGNPSILLMINRTTGTVEDITHKYLKPMADHYTKTEGALPDWLIEALDAQPA